MVTEEGRGEAEDGEWKAVGVEGGADANARVLLSRLPMRAV